MGGLNNKSNKKDLKKNENNLKYSNNNYGDIIFIPLIFDQIIKFIDNTDKMNLYLCNKKSYKLYCNQITKLKIEKKAKQSQIINVLNKYKNIEYLEINDCDDISFLDENCNIKSLILNQKAGCNLKIKDFIPLTKLDKLEILDISTSTEINNISFLKYIKNLKELHLNLNSKEIIKDTTPISYLEKLEILQIHHTINDISFLEKNKQIKNLILGCAIKDYTSISNLEKLEILSLFKKFENKNGNLYDISFLEKNKNIKYLFLHHFRFIKDYTPISKLDQLKILKFSDSNINNISFLENNNNIKCLELILLHHLN